MDRVIVYRRGSGLLRNHYFNLPRLVRPIRDEGYDITIAIAGGFSKLLAVITYATGSPRRLGFIPPAGHALEFCFSVPVLQPIAREHQIERCLRLAEPLDIPPSEIDVSFPLSPEHETWAEKQIADHGLRARKYALFNVSSARPEGRWTARSIKQTVEWLSHRHCVPTLLCGVGEDRELLRGIGSPSVVTPSVHHFAALTWQSRFLICSDGGPMHVAAAMSTPAFVLFASADPAAWRPWGVPFAYVRSGTRVADLGVEAVMQKLEEWLPTIPGEKWTTARSLA
ncbi:MAG: glycosyltransferase family 9 protein [Betaproteobacteria bacterium]|nr:glycosyltransferase family 9 protein [Betaproteobacteria bacterium]